MALCELYAALVTKAWQISLVVLGVPVLMLSMQVCVLVFLVGVVLVLGVWVHGVRPMLGFEVHG